MTSALRCGRGVSTTREGPSEPTRGARRTGARSYRGAVSPSLRRLLGAPRHLYRHGWGWLLGHRFLQLSHRGRKTGRLHHTVLEVVRYDPATGEAVVVSGFGNESDWLRNLRAGSDIVVSTGRSSSPATYRMLPADEAIDVFADYERRNIMVRPVVRASLVASWAGASTAPTMPAVGWRNSCRWSPSAPPAAPPPRRRTTISVRSSGDERLVVR